MRRSSSVEGRRLLELARQQSAQLAGGPLAESWAVVVEALARGYLAADGADSVSALLGELESGGGLRVEDLAIEVSFDDPRGETAVLSLAGEQLLVSRSALVRELRRLLRAYRGEEAPAEAASALAEDSSGPSGAESSERPPPAEAEPGAEREAGAPVAEARVELRDALSRIGAMLKERLMVAAAKTDAELGRAGAATKQRVESPGGSVRARVEGALGALREAAARAQAHAAEAEAKHAAAADAPGAADEAGSTPAEDPAAPRAPRELLTELRHQLGAGPGHGESRRKLAEAARRFGGNADSKEGSTLAAMAERFAAWVEDEAGGGAAVEGLLGKLAEALSSAHGAAAAGEAAAGEPGVTAPGTGEPDAGDKPQRHLRLVRDEAAPSSVAPSSAAPAASEPGPDDN